MPVYDTRINVPHTPANMFDLVSDISHYPDFIKWIRTMEVYGLETDGTVTRCVGDASVGFSGFSERFATRVLADSNTLSVDVELVTGPFKHLRNRWRFLERPNGATEIDFHIDYEFNNFILRMLAKNNFGLAVDRIMSAFTSEADRRYERVG